MIMSGTEGAAAPAHQHDTEHAEPFRVLLVGDGNFSFSLALCKQVWPRRRHSRASAASGRAGHGHHAHHSNDSEHDVADHQDTHSVASFESTSTAASSIGGHHRLRYAAPDPNSAGLMMIGEAALSRPVHITATSFDTEEEIITKYPESALILARLHRYAQRLSCSVRLPDVPEQDLLSLRAEMSIPRIWRVHLPFHQREVCSCMNTLVR